jgi:hypothetical protein
MRGGQVTDNVPLLTNDADMRAAEAVSCDVAERIRSEWNLSGDTVLKLLERMGTRIKHGEAGWEKQYQHLYRRLNGEVPLIKVDPILFSLAEALGIDPVELIAGAIRDCAA